MSKYRLPLNLQLFAAEGEDDDEDVVDDFDGEVINDDKDDSDDRSHSHSHSSGGIHQTLEADYWKQFLDLVKLQNEKVEASNSKLMQHLEQLSSKLEDLDRRHQAVPASVRAEIENLFEAHKQAGNIDDEGDVKEKKSKWKRH